MSAREIGRRLGVARSTIQDNLKRAAAAGLKWPLAEDVTEEALELQLFGRAAIATGQRRRVEPDWAALARELKRPGVTMMILWEEYRRGSSWKATATAGSRRDITLAISSRRKPHRFGVALGQDQADRLALFRTDRAEDIGRGGALVARR